jgi:hypothetical protein
VLEVRGGRLHLPLEIPVPLPLMIERRGENGGEDECSAHGEGQCHE